MFKIIWGSFSALVSKCPVTQKRLTIERNRLEFEIQRIPVLHICGSVDLVVFKVILGNPVHLLGLKEHPCKFKGVTYCCREAECQGPWTSFSPLRSCISLYIFPLQDTYRIVIIRVDIKANLVFGERNFLLVGVGNLANSEFLVQCVVTQKLAVVDR